MLINAPHGGGSELTTNRSLNVSLFGGSFWAVGWLFTIGFVKLSFWEGLLGLIIWPYFLGDALR